MADDFGAFSNLLLNTKISDNRYPVKGCHIWLPYGYEIKERVFGMVEAHAEDNGYRKYQFPRLIPGDSIRPVTEHIDDFEGHLFWLREKSGVPINVFLNPTGECGVYSMFRRWISSERDLPLRIYQRNSTFRPHKRPDAMLNGDELMDLLEGHSAFATGEEATREFERITEALKMVHYEMGIPYLSLTRPQEGNKPVSVRMVSFETHLPSKNRSFNVGVLYNQDQIYSSAFGVRFSRQNGESDFTHQVTFGLSERGVGAMLDLHRDRYGIRLLSTFAPEQAVVIPVYANGEYPLGYAKSVLERLGQYRTVVEEPGNTPAGKKFAAARQRGVPVRIGIGPDDEKNKTARIYLRTKEEPMSSFPVERLEEEMPRLLASVDSDIRSDAERYLSSKIAYTSNAGEIRDISLDGRIAGFAICESAPCMETIMEYKKGELLGTATAQERKGCVSCGREATNTGYFAKRSSSP